MRYFGICIHLFVFIPSVITLQLKMSERQDCRFIRRKGDFMNNNQTSAVNNTANKTFTTKYMVELAAMIAIIIIMAFTPLGYIKLPGLTITFLTIPVAVGAIILGPVGGLICGLTFGLTSLYQAVTGGSVFTFALFNISPVFTIILTVVPRTLEGLLTGLIFKGLHNIRSVQKVSYYIASLACPLLNKGYTRGDLLKNMSVPCSIGIVTAIGGSFDYAKLLKEADNAMYDAKINGKNTYVIREL